jgi:signal transduction histidine kinase
MSHELRTPMNSILGFAQLLERAQLPPEHRRASAHPQGGRHLLHLINEVLEIARIEANRHSLSLEPVRLGTVLQEAVALVRPLAAQWRVELDEGPWPGCGAYVQADRQRLTQVLLNLLGNAIKYNRPGRTGAGELRAVADGERQRCAVRVEDTGRGIPPTGWTSSSRPSPGSARSSRRWRGRGWGSRSRSGSPRRWAAR